MTLTNPTANQGILAGSTVSVAAQASDADGSVTQVEFCGQQQLRCGFSSTLRG
ncbi:Ig-like domain-containing protein [Vibrio cholerae]|nr:Ig-like domain-containing protein [Vibrio cholerae]